MMRYAFITDTDDHFDADCVQAVQAGAVSSVVRSV